MKKALKTKIFFFLGVISLILGLVGAALPLLPTTPFVILAAFFLEKGSPRLHNWLIEHKTLGPPLKDWQTHHVIRPKYKALAVALICATLSYPIFFLDRSIQVKIIMGIVGILVIAFIVTRKNEPSETNLEKQKSQQA